MSILTKFQLQSQLSSLQTLVFKFTEVEDLLSFYSLIEKGRDLLKNVSQSVRTRDNKFGSKIPWTMLCKIFSFLPSREIYINDRTCKHWNHALNSNTRSLFFPRPAKAPSTYLFLRRAQEGDAAAQGRLAECYQRGLGLCVDYEKGFKWALLSAKQGNPEGQASLGWCYLYGKGVQKNIQEGLRLCQLSAKSLNPRGQLLLGTCFKEGLGVEKNIEEGIRYYRLSVDQGDSNAQYCLGWTYFSKDIGEAIKLFRLAAVQGNTDAQCVLGGCYLKGEGVPKDEKEGVRLIQASAQAKNRHAQALLAYCYALGLGVNQDKTLAQHWYTLSALQGYAIAQQKLGNYYKVVDKEKAIYWYQRAAGQGNKEAQTKLHELKVVTSEIANSDSNDLHADLQ